MPRPKKRYPEREKALEAAKNYLRENPEVCDRLEAAIRGRTEGLAGEMMTGPDADDDI